MFIWIEKSLLKKLAPCHNNRNIC